MRKIISVIYLLCFFGLFTPLSAQVTFTASSPTPDCDDTNFCVEISVTNFDSITSFQHVYAWDTSLMQITTFTDFVGPFGLGIAPDPDSMAVGRAPYSWLTFLAFQDLADDFVIAEFCFTINNSGTGDMIFTGSNTTLQTVDGIVNGVPTGNIPAVYNNGTISVQDITAPSITCPADVTVESFGTMVNGIAPTSFSDNCTIDSVSYVMTMGGMVVGSGLNDASGETFASGVTTVTYTITDGGGNTDNCSFDVTLVDPPANSGAVQFIPEVVLDCDANTVTVNMLVVNYDSIVGQQFGMQWDGTELDFQSSIINLPAIAQLNPVPGQPQLLHLFTPLNPADIPYTLPDSSAIFSLTFDLIGSLPSPVLEFISFPGINIGVAQQQNGVDVNLVQDMTFFFMPEILNVNDILPPSHTNCPADINVSNDPGQCNAAVTWTAPTFTDNCGIDSIIVSDMPGVFPVGVDTVTYIAYDIGGNTDTCSFIITVTDDEDPVITCPGSATFDAIAGTCENNTINIGMAIASDNCGIASITNDGPTSFPVGVTTVVWTATDVNGRTATCDQTITVEDNELPMITCPADIVQCPGTTVTLGTPSTSDNCGVASVTNNAPATFPTGTTTVTWTVTDDNGNMNTCQQMVTLEDTVMPMITCPADIVQCPGTTVTLGTPTTSDDCGVASVTNNAPATFPTGTTTVTWTVTDDSGNMSTCQQMVTLEDTVMPMITCPADITECPGATITLGTPVTSDNCGVASVINDAPLVYPLGLTIVTWTVTDVGGLTNTCEQRVTIEDTELPMITCPATDAIDAAPGTCSAVYTNNLRPSVSDNCDANLTITYAVTGATSFTGIDDATDETFNVGSSNLTYYVEDDAGNIDSCTVVVQVNDNEIPIINCPNDTTIFVPSTIVDTMINNISLSASDNCGIASITFTYAGELTGNGIGDDASGTFFPPGTTTITYYVEDLNGNMDSCRFDVNITPITDDLIGCQPDQIRDNDADLCSAVVNGIAPVLLVPMANLTNVSYTLTGATTGSGTNDASGLAFNVGVTTLEYIATDNFNNMDTCSLTITVNDTQIPEWANCPANITENVNVNGACSATVLWTIPTASDNCGVESIVASHTPGDVFPVGVTPVSYVAVDTAGNLATCSFNITVVDNEPPTASCPADITINAAPGACDAVATWNPITGTDACSAVTVSCSSMSGATFPVGTTTVVCTFTDGNGNSSTCSFDVIVLDNTAPIPQNCPTDITLSPNLPNCEAIANWTPPTFVDCPPVTVTCTHQPGDAFPLGTTTVICIAIDPAGNDTTCSFNVIVEDNIAPVPSCPVDITVNSLANDCGAFVNWPLPTATDDCDANVTITQIPTPGTFFPVGSTTVTVTATDDAGNSDNCTFSIIVNDVIAPEFDCDGPIIVRVDGTVIEDPLGLVNTTMANGGCTELTIDFDAPNATDNCNVAMVNQTSGILSGGAFPIGTSPVVFTAFDDANNFVTCSFDIQVLDLEPFNVSINPNDTVCAGESIQLLTDVNAAGATFNWTGPNFASADPNPSIANVTMDNAGQYNVVVTYLSGCTDSGSETLVVNEAEGVTAVSNAPICTDGDIELDVNLPAGAVVESFAWTGPMMYTSDIKNPVIANPTADNVGVYTVVVTYDGGCFVSSSTNVTITTLPAPEITMDCITDICLGTSCVLTGTEYSPAPDFYNWTATPSSGSGLPVNTNNNQITITPTQPGNYIYNYSVSLNGCDSEETSQLVTVHGAPDAVDDAFDITFENAQEVFVGQNDAFNANIGVTFNIVTEPANGTVELTGDGRYTYTPNPGFIGVDQFIYEICYDCGPLLCDNALVTLEVSDNRDCVFPTVITPNSDGNNDELFINCLENGSFPNNEIIIYNQWGDEVFTASPYQNNWRGTHDGEDLPDGTYYMVFRLDNNAELVKQFITVFR